MRQANLTDDARLNHKPSAIWMGAGMVCNKAFRPVFWFLALAGSVMLTGCITVNAPSEAIVIELNINITQEVIYRLAADAGNTIDDNADIF